MPYTLVRHTGYSVGGKPAFQHAVEERSVSTKKEERAIRRAGGEVFGTYTQAREAAEKYNYPPTVKGVVPKANGKFVTREAFSEEIFIPN